MAASLASSQTATPPLQSSSSSPNWSPSSSSSPTFSQILAPTSSLLSTADDGASSSRWYSDSPETTQLSYSSGFGSSTPYPSSSTYPGVNGTSPGLPTPAAAGIGVGCFFAGALMAFVLCFFIMRRKMKRREHGRAIAPTSISPSTPEKSLHSLPKAAQLNQHLLDTTPDAEIVREMQALGELIRQHTEYNYQSWPLKMARERISKELHILGFSADRSEQLLVMVKNPKLRQSALQHVLSTVIFSRVSFQAQHHHSLLPASMGVFLSQIAPASRGKGDDQGKHWASLKWNTPINLTISAYTEALTRWRRLSTFLLHPNRSMRTPLPANSDDTQQKAKTLAQSLNRFLLYFVEEDHVSRQTAHLQDVILECTKLGYTLLSQPSTWHFVFEGGSSQSFVVNPGLTKIGDGDSVPREVLMPASIAI